VKPAAISVSVKPFAPVPRIRSKTDGDPAAGSHNPPNFSQPGYGIRPDWIELIAIALSKVSLLNGNLSTGPRRRSTRPLSIAV
jgi:hypothetical protein